MDFKHLLLNLIVLCGALFVTNVVCLKNNDIQRDLSTSHSNETEILNGNDVHHWPPWQRFRCPTAWGAYPDPNNCAYFYICVAKIPTRTRCPLMYHFCKNRRVCLPMLIAVCDDGSEVTKNEETTTTQEEETLFVCPEEKGRFPHHHDCSKYYSCKNYQATLEICQDSELFDGVKGRCRDAKKVHCGSRIRPTDIPHYEKTTESEEVGTETTNKETLPEVSTPHQEVSTPQEESTTVEEESTTKVRVTAPDTTCDVDDLDCIIDDLGETPSWFVCPDAVGSYPHPTSNKLFIFCLNWKPSVKKCGQDLIFSEDHMTCVSP
ncbi:hypothetical protein JTE90_016510 [Oedothorax gibbosus]|uniref:Chitin-binding type-2 domain-containing protein n=1 Tax=Oedothorax gibbosus TaxID=931172 RepID=A0AAV6U422_9ARAC|nr:hypothetical protein JTE90_016510 [Oedothorax gibbosus]